jgi:GT2 family glycosyltransferase
MTAITDSGPRVTVVVTTHRPNPYFAEALASVRAQTWTDWEMIVVDDGWEDRDELRRMVAPDESTRLVHHAPAGVARTRNHGLAEARGSLISFLDHDDHWRADHLATLIEAIDTDPRASASYGVIRAIDQEGRTLSESTAPPATLETVFAGGPRPSINSLLARRELVIRVGGFEQLVEPAEDIDMIYKLALEGPFVPTNELTCFYRRHEGNITNNLVLAAETADRMLRLQEAGARYRGDEHTVGLLRANRAGVKDYWARQAHQQAVAALRAGEFDQARALFRWYARFAPKAFARNMVHESTRQLTGLPRRLRPTASSATAGPDSSAP